PWAVAGTRAGSLSAGAVRPFRAGRVQRQAQRWWLPRAVSFLLYVPEGPGGLAPQPQDEPSPPVPAGVPAAVIDHVPSRSKASARLLRAHLPRRKTDLRSRCLLAKQ